MKYSKIKHHIDFSTFEWMNAEIYAMMEFYRFQMQIQRLERNEKETKTQWNVGFYASLGPIGYTLTLENKIASRIICVCCICILAKDNNVILRITQKQKRK